jgi:hypothetical protein
MPDVSPSLPRFVGAAVALLAALGLAGAGASPAAAQTAKAKTYKSPGYKGRKTIPNVNPTPLPLLPLGTGKYPHVLVDAAGTGHVMFAVDGNSSAPDQVSYCRLQRGQKACASTSALAPDAPAGGTPGDYEGNFPGGNHDFTGPTPLAIGNQLFLVDRRFPDAFKTPAGKTSASNVFMWTSEDGGGTFNGPAIIGDNQNGGGAVVYGGAASPSIGTISRTQTEGTFFQGTGAGTYGTAKAQLGTPAQAYDGNLAVEGDRPIAAFADEVSSSTGTVIVRKWTGSGDINDQATWSTASFPGSEPRITSGPGGTFVVYRDSLVGGQTLVQKIVDGAPAGAPSLIAGAIREATIAENPAGALVASYIDDAGVQLRRSTDGVNWSPAELIAQTPAGGQLSGLAVAATADGGGFATMIENATGAEGVGQVAAAVFGTQKATGLPGLGQLPGGGIGSAIGDQLATTTCTDTTFGAVTAEVQAGCWLHDPSAPNLNVTLGEVNLNGLRIVPDAGVKIAIDPKLHTIDTTGSVSVILTGGGLNITLFHGELHVKLPTAAAGTDLFDFSGIEPPDVAGFPIKGHIDVKLVKDGVSIPVSLSLPDAFGGVTGAATLTATLANGLQLDSLEFKVDDVSFGAAQLTAVDIKYTKAGEAWSGKGTLNVPSGGKAFSLSLDIEFDHGEYRKGAISLGLPYPGIPIDASDTPPQLYWTAGGLAFGIKPIALTGSASFGLIPLYTGAAGAKGTTRDYVFSLDGTLGVTFGKPVTITATATGFFYTLQISQSKLVYGIPDELSLASSAKIDLGLLSAEGGLSAIIDPKNSNYGGQFNSTAIIHLSKLGLSAPLKLVTGSGDLKIPGVGFAINKTGFGAYLPFGLSPVPMSITYHWGDDFPSAHPFVNLTSDFTAGLPATGARAHRLGAGAQTFTVPKNAPAMAVDVHGSGHGAPSVILTAPDGTEVIPSTEIVAGQTAVAIGDPDAGVTHIGIDKPQAGTWGVRQADNTEVPVDSVLSAVGLRDPKIKATVSAKGSKRVLHYSVDAPPGVTVTFAEQNAGLFHSIGTAKGKKGTLSFTPATGKNRSRKIVATIVADDVPHGNKVVASFKAPKPPSPGKPKSVKVTNTKHTFKIKWTAPSNADRVLVEITATDGRRLQKILPRKTHSLSVPVIGFNDQIKVAVRGLAASGGRGAPARATSKRTK